VKKGSALIHSRQRASSLIVPERGSGGAPRIGRRGFIGVALVGVAVTGAMRIPQASAAGSGTLHLFLHSHRTARSLEELLEAALSGVTVRAFSRAKDFVSGLSSHPDAVLAASPVLEALGYSPTVHGLRGGEDHEPYVLLSTRAVTPTSVQTVGAVDLLGRERMPEFIAGLLGGHRPNVVPVTKLLDLLPLLQFDKVDSVIVPARSVSLLTERTRMSLNSTHLPKGEVGLPALSPLTAVGHEIGAKVRRLSLATSLEIGVDSWR
jgi:hypothetical protein